jgi:hypothetical protein
MSDNVLFFQLRKFFRRRVEGVPWLAVPVLRVALGRSANQVVSRDTQVLFEGAGGSANTFAFMAFKFAQGGDSSVNIAGHTHYSAQVIQAIRWRIPVFIAIRDPVDSIDSLLSRRGFSNANERLLIARLYLLDYITFYRAVVPYSGHCIISDFECTVNNINHCIRMINEKYDKKFNLFDDSEIGMKSCFGDWKNVVTDPTRSARRKDLGSISSIGSLEALIRIARTYYNDLKLNAI